MKKKYLEPKEKLTKNINNKKNIDNTIRLYENLKNIKIDFKQLKINFEKEKNLYIDTKHSSAVFQRIKNEICSLGNIEDYKKIEFIKEELNWFIENEPKILDFYKQKFSEAVKKMVKKILINFTKKF